jgi:hypothetical protein
MVKTLISYVKNENSIFSPSSVVKKRGCASATVCHTTPKGGGN